MNYLQTSITQLNFAGIDNIVKEFLLTVVPKYVRFFNIKTTEFLELFVDNTVYCAIVFEQRFLNNNK